MTNYESDYLKLLHQVAFDADEPYRKNRTGSKSMMKFGQSLTVNLQEGYPILIGRKMYTNTIFNELKWFTNGETNIKRFQDAGIKIWDKWADSKGELGPVYGHQLRNFAHAKKISKYGIDQLKKVIDNLQSDPHSRRHVVTLWSPSEIEMMKLPPCYHTFTFSVVHDKLNCHVTMRSSDVFVGLPYDVALFAAMVHLICKTLKQTYYTSRSILKGKPDKYIKTTLVPGKLHFSLTDAHIYWDNVEPCMEYIDDMAKNKDTLDVLPKLLCLNNTSIFTFEPEDLELVKYNPKKSYKVEVVE